VAKLRAVILAAGRGVRMGGRVPKTLLPLGGEQPLLHHILSGLRTAGITDLMVVTGFQPAQVQDYINGRWNADDVTYVFNARYASWGNFHSVRVALDQSPGMDVLIVNSDVIVHPDVYARTAAKEGDLVLAVQKREPHRLDEEDMRVEIKRDRVLSIGKDIKMARSHGEFAGVSLVRPVAARAYLNLSTNLEWRSATTLYYEDLYGAMLSRVDARAALVGPDEYAEVDKPADVEGAQSLILRHPDAWSGAEATASAP
jgi:choline kinase